MAKEKPIGATIDSNLEMLRKHLEAPIIAEYEEREKKLRAEFQAHSDTMSAQIEDYKKALKRWESNDTVAFQQRNELEHTILGLKTSLEAAEKRIHYTIRKIDPAAADLIMMFNISAVDAAVWMMCGKPSFGVMSQEKE